MILRIRLTVLVFGLLFMFRVQAQTQWTLDDCIAYALKHSLNKRTQDLNLAISKERWQQGKRDMLPTINVSYPSYNVSFGRTLDPVTNSFVDTRFVSGLSGGLSSSLTLFQAFRKWHEIAYQKIIYESSKLDNQQTEYDLAFKIMDLYNQVLYCKGALTIVEKQQSTNQLLEKAIVKKVELGLMAKADLYEIEATTEADALAVLKAQNLLDQAKLALIQKMNLNTEDIELTAPLENAVSSDSTTFQVDEVFSVSQEVLPHLQKSKLQVATSKKQLQLNRTALFPTIRLSGDISTSYSDNFKDVNGETISLSDQLKNNQSKYIGISMSYPIFGNWRTRSQIKIAKKELEIASNNLDIEKQEVYKAIKEMVQRYEALKAEIKLNQVTLKAKSKALDIVQKKYERNLVSLYELQLASNVYLNAKIEHVRLKSQLTMQQRTLDFYNGKFTLPLTADIE
ncbi:TolC family protein [Zhouia spongiae]|uniref:TolC family protein n=1 Tax=Zhouia spongiae TaxID=2202721 RepID=A0ABY3YLB1_9FLAO|nr:TolC family protein [Zhouia spongiae]UNY98584.1 TolC family protein [Zhouia spongiae]